MSRKVTIGEDTTTHLNGKTTHREAVAWRPIKRCGKNEMRAWYRYQRDRFCNALTGRVQQIPKPGVRCICKYGYFRAQDRSCYPLRYCWRCQGRRNERFSPCVSDCMKVCGESDIQQCSMPCKIGCECKKGYIRKKRPNGPCVPIWTCPPKCGPSMEFRRYRPRCPRKCNNSRSSCSPENQGPGCACKRGYVLKTDYGSIKSRASCVRETSCRKPRNQNNDYQIKTKG